MTRHSLMLTNLLLSLPVAAGLLCAAPSASAQTSERVTIPFAFSANHQKVSAGTYAVERSTNFLVSLRNLETGKIQILTVHPGGGGVIETQGSLVFHRDGTDYSLMEIKIAGSSFRSELAVQPKIQQAVAKHTPPAGSTVEVAMR